MSKTTLTCYMSEHIGQVKESEAQAEIDRLNSQNTELSNKIWRKDYSDELFELDSTEHEPKMYSREEVIDIVEDLCNFFDSENRGNNFCGVNPNKWISKNLNK